jgi:thioredoxin-like negative regulator of GroEL
VTPLLPGVVWEKDVGTAIIGAAAAYEPCVVLLGKPPSNDYQGLVKQFEDSRFEPLRRFSVWAKANPDTDSYARTIADTLHITSLPAVVILEPTGDEIKEAARVAGYADAPALEARLGPAIHKVFDVWQAKRERAPTPTP